MPPSRRPRETHTVVAERSGVVTRVEALPFGIGAWRLGAGRAVPRTPSCTPRASTCT